MDGIQSGIASWKEMEDSIDFRGVTDVAEFQFEIEILFDTVNLQ